MPHWQHVTGFLTYEPGDLPMYAFAEDRNLHLIISRSDDVSYLIAKTINLKPDRGAACQYEVYEADILVNDREFRESAIIGLSAKVAGIYGIRNLKKISKINNKQIGKLIPKIGGKSLICARIVP
jgi:hypothetical protein